MGCRLDIFIAPVIQRPISMEIGLEGACNLPLIRKNSDAAQPARATGQSNRRVTGIVMPEMTPGSPPDMMWKNSDLEGPFLSFSKETGKE